MQSPGIQKVRGDEWPYRVRQLRSMLDYLMGFKARPVAHPHSLPCWPVQLNLNPWRAELFEQAEQILHSQGEWLGALGGLTVLGDGMSRTSGNGPWTVIPLASSGMAQMGRSKVCVEILRLDGLLVLALAGQAGHAEAHNQSLKLWKEFAHHPSTLSPWILYTVGIENAFRLVKCLILNQIL